MAILYGCEGEYNSLAEKHIWKYLGVIGHHQFIFKWFRKKNVFIMYLWCLKVWECVKILKRMKSWKTGKDEEKRSTEFHQKIKFFVKRNQGKGGEKKSNSDSRTEK